MMLNLLGSARGKPPRNKTHKVQREREGQAASHAVTSISQRGARGQRLLTSNAQRTHAIVAKVRWYNMAHSKFSLQPA
jgi:hypothetical protein